MKAYVGTSGWQYKDWNKRFFPKSLPKKDWLGYLSTKFNTVEVNTTFYHLPKASVFDKWKSEVTSGFLFTLKFNRLFTHFKRLNLDKDDLKIMDSFIVNGSRLGSKLGPILIQFPQNFHKNTQQLEFLFTNLGSIEQKYNLKLMLAFEFRHESWFADEILDLLKRHQAALVITNSPAWPSKVIKTADFVYMRFHGRNKLYATNYTEKELEDWSKKLKSLKPKKIFAYFNNDANAYAADNAFTLQKLLA